MTSLKFQLFNANEGRTRVQGGWYCTVDSGISWMDDDEVEARKRGKYIKTKNVSIYDVHRATRRLRNVSYLK